MQAAKTKSQREARRDNVLRLYLRGASAREIANSAEFQSKFGPTSHVTVSNDIRVMAGKLGEKYRDTQKAYLIQLRKYEELERLLWPKAQENNQTLLNLLRVMARKEYLLGIEPARRVAVGGDDKGMPVQVTVSNPMRQSFDWSRLSVDELGQMEYLFAKMQANLEDGPPKIAGEDVMPSLESMIGSVVSQDEEASDIVA